MRQTFGSPSVLSGCFNVNPLAVRSRDDHHHPGGVGVGKDGGGGGLRASIPRVDTEGLDAVYAGLVGLGPRVASELWSSIEEVRSSYSLGRSPFFSYNDVDTGFVFTCFHGNVRRCYPAIRQLTQPSPPPPLPCSRQGLAGVAASQKPSTPASPPSSSSSASPPGLEAAGVSFLLKYWQGSPFSRDVAGWADGQGSRDKTMERICQAVLGLKGHARWWIMRRSVVGDFVILSLPPPPP